MANRTESLRLFCAAAEAPNFRAAAMRLGVSPQVVSRAIRDIEEDLGEILFHRNTRGVQLSLFGQQFLEKARHAIHGLDALYHRKDRRAASEHVGVVRVAAPSAIGRRFLVKALSSILRQHPGLVLDLRLSEALADVVEEQIDVGIRVGSMRDSRFVARAAGEVPFFIVATPRLLARIGTPATIEELFARPVTALIDRNTGRPWPWLFAGGRQVAAQNPCFLTNDPDSEFEAVLAGAGLGQIPGYLCSSYLRSGRLMAVLPEFAPPPWMLYVYRTQRTPVPARVRLVYDLLLKAMQEELEPH